MKSTLTLIKKAATLSALMVVLVFACGGSLNPLAWKTHAERFISPSQLVQPEKTASFYADMEDTVKDNPVQMFSYIERKIRYTNDLFNYKALNHLPTTEEVLQSGKDDCDGQAVLLCSVLRHAGYNAYAVIGPNHAWVEVQGVDLGEDLEGEDLEGEELLLINYRGGARIVKFNESYTEWYYVTLLFVIIGDFLLLTGFFTMVLYIFTKSVQSYIQESFGFFKYIIALVLMAALAAVIMAKYWVPGLMAASVAFLVIMEIIARVRGWGGLLPRSKK
jgi:hypothetical protein